MKAPTSADAKNEAEPQGDRTFWQNFIRKFHFEVNIQNLVIAISTENPTRKATSFHVHLRDVSFTKERPASDIIDYHFRLAIKEIEGKMLLNETTTHRILCIRALFPEPSDSSGRLTSSLAVSLDIKILRQLKSSLSTQSDKPTRKQSTLSEEIEKRLIIRANVSCIQTLLSPLICIYLQRLLTKLGRTSYHRYLIDAKDRNNGKTKNSKQKLHKIHDLNDLKKLTSSFINTMDNLSTRIAKCEAATARISDMPELELKATLSKNLLHSEESNTDDSVDSEEDGPKLIIDIETHLETFVMGYMIDIVENPLVFSWIEINRESKKRLETYELFDMLCFEDLLMDHYLFMMGNLHLNHESNQSRTLVVSLQAAQVIRLGPIKEVILSKHQSLETKNKNVIQENAHSASKNHINHASFMKVQDDFNSIHDDNFYSAVEDSVFMSVKDKNNWEKTPLLNFCKISNKNEPLLRIELDTITSGTTSFMTNLFHEAELNINPTSLPLNLLVRGWQTALYQVQRYLQMEDLSPKKGAYLAEENKSLYHGLKDDQLKEFFFTPLLDCLKNPQRLAELTKGIIGDSILQRLSFKFSSSKVSVNIQTTGPESSSLVAVLDGCFAEWEGPSKNLTFKVLHSLKVEVQGKEQIAGSLSEAVGYPILNYRPSKQDKVVLGDDCSRWLLCLHELDLVVSLKRLSLIEPILKTWIDELKASGIAELTAALSLHHISHQFDRTYNHFEDEAQVYSLLEQALDECGATIPRVELAAVLRQARLKIEDDSAKIMRECFLSKTQIVTDDLDEWMVPNGTQLLSLKEDTINKNRYWENKSVEDKTILILEVKDVMALQTKEEPETLLVSVFAGRLQDGFTQTVYEQADHRGDVEIFCLSNYLFRGKETPIAKLSLEAEDLDELSREFYSLWQSNALMNNFIRLKIDMQARETSLVFSPCILKQRADAISLLDAVVQQVRALTCHPLASIWTSGEPSSPSKASRSVLKVNFQQVFIDVVDHDSFRFITKVTGLNLKIDQRSDKTNSAIEVKQMQAYGSTEIDAITQMNCYNLLEDSKKFFKILSFNNLSWTIVDLNDNGELEIEVKLPMREERERQGPEIWISPFVIKVLLGTSDYFSRLSLVLSGFMQAADKQGESPKLRSKLGEAKRTNKAHQALKKECKQKKKGDDSFEMVGNNIQSIETVLECLACKALDSAEATILKREEDDSTENLRSLSRKRLLTHVSKLHVYVFCEQTFDNDRYLELRCSDLNTVYRSDIFQGTGKTPLGSEETFLATIGGLALVDNVETSIFQYVLEMNSMPIAVATSYYKLDTERNSNALCSQSSAPKRKTSESIAECSTIFVPEVQMRKKSFDLVELTPDVGHDLECKRFLLDDTIGLRLVLNIKPLNLFLTESSSELMIEFCKEAKKVMGQDTKEKLEASTNSETVIGPTISIDYLYVSDIEISCRASSKSLLTPVKYLPTLDIALSMFLVEGQNSMKEKQLWEKIQAHYLGELKLKELLRSNLKNIAVVAQFLKLSHALVSIYQYLKYRDREVSPYLHMLKDFILWNIFKTGELGVSVLGDIFGSLGKLVLIAGYDYLRRNKYFDKLEKKLFLLENGRMDSLKSL
jgi:hypothetical protein